MFAIRWIQNFHFKLNWRSRRSLAACNKLHNWFSSFFFFLEKSLCLSLSSKIAFYLNDGWLNKYRTLSNACVKRWRVIIAQFCFSTCHEWSLAREIPVINLPIKTKQIFLVPTHPTGPWISKNGNKKISDRLIWPTAMNICSAMNWDTTMWTCFCQSTKHSTRINVANLCSARREAPAKTVCQAGIYAWNFACTVDHRVVTVDTMMQE